MAKKAAAGGVNKSKAIRDYLAANPDATAKTIVPALKAQGVEVNSGYVAMIKSQAKSGPGKGKKKKAKASAKKATATPVAPKAARKSSANSLSAADVIAAKSFADQVGSVEQALKAIETLQQLR